MIHVQRAHPTIDHVEATPPKMHDRGPSSMNCMGSYIPLRLLEFGRYRGDVLS
jgi:hypothetical protein